MLLDQIQITLFWRLEQKILHSVHGQIKCPFTNQSAKPLPLMRLLIKLLQMRNIDIQNGRIDHRLSIIVTGRLIDKTFVGHNNLVLRKKENVLFFAGLVVYVVRSENTIENKTQMFTDVLVLIVKLAFLVVLFLPVGNRQRKGFLINVGKCA